MYTLFVGRSGLPAASPPHHGNCSGYKAALRHAPHQRYRLRIQSAENAEQSVKKTKRAKKTTSKGDTASKTSPKRRGRPKKQETEEEAPEAAATATPEASVGGQQPSEDVGKDAPAEEESTAEEDSEEEDFSGWTENEYWKAILEQHSPEEVMAELKKMEEEGLLPDEQEEVPMFAAARPGVTPFEYIEFTDETLEHNIDIIVNAPVEKVYQIWSNRLNYSEWFDLISQMVLHTEDPDFASYFIGYQWGKLPTLELYATMERSMEENKFVLERAVDGMMLAVGAYFKEAEGGTEVNLRVSYALAENLRSYVGPVGVWGDVNDTLQDNLVVMKHFVEQVNLEELKQTREESQAEMDKHLADTNKTLDELREELRQEGVEPGEGSPSARAEMLNILEEMGFDAEATVRGPPKDEPSWWEQEQAARDTERSISAAASEEEAVQQRQEEREAQAKEAEDRRKAKVARQSAGAKKGPKGASDILTKEFLEEKMHHHTQKEVGAMAGVGTATVSRLVKQYNLKWPIKRRSMDKI